MKKLLLTSVLLLCCSLFLNAQDSWSNVITNGFDNSSNGDVNSLYIFKGQLYAGMGTSEGSLFRSSTGNTGDWAKVFSMPNYTSVNAINSTAQGGGYLYIASNACCSDVPGVFRSPDGLTWTPYYTSANYNNLPFIFPFNGLGINDSMYVVLSSYQGDVIIKSAYDSNDPSNVSASWDTVLDFSQVAGYTGIRSFVKHNSKMYLGTTNMMGYYANLWSSADGRNWVQNTHVGSGFGDGSNTSISALASHAGYIYAGTANNAGGAQIWRSNDDTTWTMVVQYPGIATITSITDIGGTLWITADPANAGNGQVLKSTDDTTFVFSNSNGFGVPGINGSVATTIGFGNNIYWGGENYSMPSLRAMVSSGPHGAQIWRLCTLVPAPISAGSDQTVCNGISADFSATPGFLSYDWDQLGANPIDAFNTNIPGVHFVTAVDANGCNTSDTVNLNVIPSPSSYVINPDPPAFVCKGNTLNIATSSISGIRNPLPPMSRVINDSILDYSAPTDTMVVSGIIDDGINNTLVSVTIDSLYHQQDGDIAITLIAPDGSSMNLSNYNGYGSQNYIGTVFTPTATSWIGYYNGPFTGTYSPNDPFDYLTGPTNGIWRLQVYDSYAGNQGVFKGWTLNFSQPDTNMTYTWSPAAGLSAANTPNTVATGITTTTYSLTITNTIGCTATDTVQVIVPAVHIVASSDSICSGSSTNLYVTGSSSFLYWTPNPSLSVTGVTGDSATASPSANTTYYVSDTVAGCAVNDSILIHVDSALVVPFIASQTICHGDSVTLSGSASSGTAPYTYWWYDGASAHNGQVQNYGPVTTTTYTLQVTDAFMCMKSTTTDVNVTPSTDIYGHVNYSGGSLNSGNVVLYKYLPVLTHFDTLQTCSLVAGNYHFTAVDHAQYLIEVFADTMVAPLSVPTYYGDVFLWNSHPPVSHGCSLPDTFNITLVETPVMTGPGSLHGNISAGPGFGMPPGFPVAGGGIIGRSDPIPGIDVKLGHNPGGQLFAQTQTDASGNYSFNNVAFNTGSAGDLGYTVYVDIPGLARDSSYSVTVNAANPAYYYLDYIADSSSIDIVPDAGTGISNPTFAAQNKFNVYPNPFRGNTNIEFTIDNTANVSLEVYNVLGTKIKTITSGKQQAGEYKYNLNNQDANLNQGVYFITLTIDGKSATQRVMVIE